MRALVGIQVATLLLASFVLAGCAGEVHRLAVPLSGSGSGGTVYVLQGARFRVAGEGITQTLQGDDTVGPQISASLPLGDYTIRLLDGWQLVRVADGTPMVATLVSANPQSFAIGDAMSTQVVFVFEVMGEMVPMSGDGTLDVGFEVEEMDAGTPDAGTPDAGTSDAGPDASIGDAGLPCVDGGCR